MRVSQCRMKRGRGKRKYDVVIEKVEEAAFPCDKNLWGLKDPASMT